MSNGDEMSEERLQTQRPVQEAQFISGWFTAQVDAGKEPDYGYPKNHLPETRVDAVDMVTGFVACKGK